MIDGIEMFWFVVNWMVWLSVVVSDCNWFGVFCVIYDVVCMFCGFRFDCSNDVVFVELRLLSFDCSCEYCVSFCLSDVSLLLNVCLLIGLCVVLLFVNVWLSVCDIDCCVLFICDSVVGDSVLVLDN